MERSEEASASGRGRSRSRARGTRQELDDGGMPGTPVFARMHRYLPIRWDHIYDSATAAIIACEWRILGRQITDGFLSRATTQMAIAMRDWVGARRTEYMLVLHGVMNDRRRNGMRVFDSFNDYLDSFDDQMNSRLDIIQLTAISDIMARNITVLQRVTRNEWIMAQIMIQEANATSADPL